MGPVLASPHVRRRRCPSVRIGVPQWEHLAGERLGPGAARQRLRSQRYRHEGSRFHSDTSVFTGIQHFASVITLAKWQLPFENSASLAKQPEFPHHGCDILLTTGHRLPNGPGVHPLGMGPSENVAPVIERPARLPGRRALPYGASPKSPIGLGSPPAVVFRDCPQAGRIAA